jgi:hypothetical protein
MILKRVARDKKFCKWLVRHSGEITARRYYMATILEAYKSGKPLWHTQALAEFRQKLYKESRLEPIRTAFVGSELERLYVYLQDQETSPQSYLDYFNACRYLGLDMELEINRYPHNFKHRHDTRIDEYHAAQLLADEQEREEFNRQFAAVAMKYTALQKLKGGSYAVFIAELPSDLVREGEQLSHCVGKMNYSSKVVREESLISFVRDRLAPAVPFVTVEYSPKSKNILQCYGHGNSRPDEAVLRYVHDNWLPYANKAVKRLCA